MSITLNEIYWIRYRFPRNALEDKKYHAKYSESRD